MENSLSQQFAEAVLSARQKKSLPLTIHVDYGASVVDYILNKTEYRGVIRRKSDNKACEVTHFINFEGFVGPAVATNRLVQKDPFIREHNKAKDYRKLITHLLEVALLAVKASNQTELSKVGEQLALPKWLKLEKGEMSTSDCEKAALANVDIMLMEFAESSGYRINVDTKKLLSHPSIITPKHIRVVEGEWDEESQSIAKNIMLSPGHKMLAMKDGLKLERKVRSKRKKKLLEGEELKLGIEQLKEKFSGSCQVAR